MVLEPDTEEAEHRRGVDTRRCNTQKKKGQHERITLRMLKKIKKTTLSVKTEEKNIVKFYQKFLPRTSSHVYSVE